MSDEGKYIKCGICLIAFTSDEAFRNHSSAQHKTFTPDEARALWQAASRTPGSIASRPLESGLAKLLPMAEVDDARRPSHDQSVDECKTLLKALKRFVDFAAKDQFELDFPVQEPTDKYSALYFGARDLIAKADMDVP